MAEVKLTVRTNFTEAEQDLQKLGGTVQSTMKTMTEAEKALGSKNIDLYLEKQSRLASATSITRGQAESNIIIQRNLRNEYERLHRQGIDPTSEGMVRLESELRRVNEAVVSNANAVKLNAESLERNQQAQVMVATAATASLAAIVALSAGMIANTANIASNVDEMTETASALGMTAQEYQTLAFAAERSGTSVETFTNASAKLNIEIGKARDGSGALYNALKDTNPQLLEQMVNAESSSKAFGLMTEAIGGVENPFDRAALAGAAFGKGNREILNSINMATGPGGISSLIDESYRYGVVSDSLVEKSGAWDDAQVNLNASIFGFRAFMAEKLMPTMTVVMQGFADFISNTDNLKAIMIIATPFVVAFTAGIVGLLIATKAGAAINFLTGAMAALNAVLLTNPAIAITAAIVGIVAAIILVVRNWDWCQKQLTIGINYLKGAFATIGLAIIKNISEPLATIADAGRDIPVLGKFFGQQADALATVNSYLKENATIMRDNAVQSIISAENELEAMKRLKEAEKLKNEIVSGGGGIIPGGGRSVATVAASKAVAAETKPEEIAVNQAIELTALSDKYAYIESKDAAHKQNLYSQSEQFWNQESELSTLATEAKIEKMTSDFERLKEMKILEADELAAMEQALIEKISALKDAELQKDIERKVKYAGIMSQMAGNVAQTFDNLAGILKNMGVQNRAMLVLAKAASIAQIGFSTGVAVMQVMADATIPSYWMKIGLAASTAAMGVTQAVKVATTPIPSAETGIRDFTVPDSTRVDASYLRVNRDEKVSVTPRGEDSSKMQSTTVMLDGRVILRTVQEFFDNGELRVNDFNIAGAY